MREFETAGKGRFWMREFETREFEHERIIDLREFERK